MLHKDPCGLVWEMEDSSGWKRIERDFGKFSLRTRLAQLSFTCGAVFKKTTP
jgi:hypothetical protein